MSELSIYIYKDTSSTTQVAKIMVKHWRSSGTSWTKFVRTATCAGETVGWCFNGTWMGKSAELGMPVCSPKTRIISVSICGQKQKMAPMWKKLMKNVDFEEPTSFLDHVYLGCTQRECMPNESYWTIYKDVRITYFCWSNWKITGVGKTHTQRRSRRPTTWKDMLKSALTDIANWPTKRQSCFSKSQSSPCLDDHHFKKDELESGRELSNACSQIVLECLYLARIGSPNILWLVNKLAISVTKWSQACDRQFARLIS